MILRLKLIPTEIPLQQREAYFYLMFACNVKCQNIRPQLRSISHSNKGEIKIFHVSASLSLVSSEFHDRPALKTLSKHYMELDQTTFSFGPGCKNIYDIKNIDGLASPPLLTQLKITITLH